MRVSCPHCSRVLEFSGDAPLFCAYCGRPLRDRQLEVTGAYVPSTPMPLYTPGSGSGSGGGEAVETEFAPGSGRGGGSSPGNQEWREPDPEEVAGYRIVRLLGRGGMGSVYEAEDSAIGRRVALKLISVEYLASIEAVERFRQEGRMASAITHPRCVFVLGADEYQGRPYIVMELMPGATLQGLVEERGGPLPAPEAIAKILDVIDGLREAHLLGVIHRDVKPSNCFLDVDGRVKIGDFGLSKSLDRDAGLTRTGSFVGTPLYASPEQIKRDAVDERTDVYSAAATLYFLLTGRPPFQADDAAAALAKIVSENPTPLRELRPELPPALEAAVLRGLARDRNYRFADLGRFREALLPFVSEGLRLPDLALRLSAFFADWTLTAALGLVIFGVFSPGHGHGQGDAATMLVCRLLCVLYFGLSEGIWGASLGKRLTGLRVSGAPGSGPPGVARGLARALAFYLLVGLPEDLTAMGLTPLLPTRRGAWLLVEPFSLAAALVGTLVMATPMRARNGYRGLHEWLTGTRVVRLPASRRRRAPRTRRPPARWTLEHTAPAPVGTAGLLKGIGPFRVAGAVIWDGRRRVLLGEDPSLRRTVWLVLRPRGSPAPSPARRDLGRPSRPRWLRGGEQSDFRWDAYSPQLGCSLADLAGPDGLPWADVRPILHDLADELARACADGTLPERLSVEQVWVQPDGTVQLVDFLEPSTSGQTPSDPPGDAERALNLLARTAALALEGGRRRGGSSARITAIQAPVPSHAGRMLDRLIGQPRPGDAPYTDVAELVADLEADRDKPTEVDTARRAAHLGPAILTGVPILVAVFALTSPRAGEWLSPWWVPVALAGLAAFWSALTRGGVLLSVTGLALVRSDARPAERWRCVWRSLIVWLPVATPLALAAWLSGQAPPHTSLAWVCWGTGLAVAVVAPLLALVWPSRSIHDRLAGTWVVPK
ncbi:MAG: protein kinase [Isosphaeraceae bacterium]